MIVAIMTWSARKLATSRVARAGSSAPVIETRVSCEGVLSVRGQQMLDASS